MGSSQCPSSDHVWPRERSRNTCILRILRVYVGISPEDLSFSKSGEDGNLTYHQGVLAVSVTLTGKKGWGSKGSKKLGPQKLLKQDRISWFGFKEQEDQAREEV